MLNRVEQGKSSIGCQQSSLAPRDIRFDSGSVEWLGFEEAKQKKVGKKDRGGGGPCGPSWGGRSCRWRCPTAAGCDRSIRSPGNWSWDETGPPVDILKKNNR